MAPLLSCTWPTSDFGMLSLVLWCSLLPCIVYKFVYVNICIANLRAKQRWVWYYLGTKPEIKMQVIICQSWYKVGAKSDILIFLENWLYLARFLEVCMYARVVALSECRLSTLCTVDIQIARQICPDCSARFSCQCALSDEKFCWISILICISVQAVWPTWADNSSCYLNTR